MFTTTFARNVLNRRDVVHLFEIMIQLAVSGLRRDVLHKNYPDGFVCREFVHNNYHHTPSLFFVYRNTMTRIINYCSNKLLSSWHYQGEYQANYQVAEAQVSAGGYSYENGIIEKNRPQSAPLFSVRKCQFY